MGTYLSSPIVEKGVDSGECLDDKISPLAWGMVDMQGWRKSMEDAHVADTVVKVLPHLLLENTEPNIEAGKVFAVFDGHGGPEVARFCQLYLVDVLTKQQRWLEETPVNSESRDPASSPVGSSLIESFHALDRMINDISRRDELIRLRTDKPQHGDSRTAEKNSIPPAKSLQKSEPAGTGGKPQSKTTEEQNKTEETKTESEEKDANDVSMEEKEEESSDEDSTNVVGREDAEELDCEDEQGEDMELEKNSFAKEGVISALHGESGVVVATMPTTNKENDGSEERKNVETAVVPTAPQAATGVMPPTIIQNGRQICNLPDHPIHAGCTAVVAVLIGRSLTIANAGDSRTVLCRAGGRTEPLSFDHKPHQEREMNRIMKAGGFVNQFGRVNGNLNLSRSIGDLKYKQVPGLEPSEQMITADPDIVQVLLQPKDEFIILGCDGIWDCLSNEQAVKFVRDRIDTKTPTEIGTEMLDEIISDDPRATQGIGGDNMTILIVDLQPAMRAYR